MYGMGGECREKHVVGKRRKEQKATLECLDWKKINKENGCMLQPEM
jgi:hypothetical protein